MAGPIYKVYMGRKTAAAHELSEEEFAEAYAELGKLFEEVGAKCLVHCNSNWSSERWQFFGVDEFPDIESLQRYEAAAREAGWYRYVDSMSVLGTEA